MKLKIALLIVLAGCCLPPQLQASGRLVINVVDRDTGQPIAVRMHLKNAAGRPVKPPPGVPVLGDHFVFFDKIDLKLQNGGYAFLIERGPEYLEQTGHFQIDNFADDTKTISMKRFVDMAKEGWYSGDLDVNRPEKDLKLLMQADDVHFVPLVTWSNKKNPWSKQPLPKQANGEFDQTFFYSLLGGELATPGNTLRIFGLEKPLDLAATQSPLTPTLSRGGEREKNSGPSPVAGEGRARGKELTSDVLGSLPLIPIIEKARQEQHAWVDAGAFFARDLPIWIAAGQIDSIQLANRHLEREGVVANEAGGWPRDPAAFPNPHGNARWSQEIYYHLLDCGLRIPPSAGSGSGVSMNPVGYNRVYAHLDSDAEPSPLAGEGRVRGTELTWDKWWDALRAGRVSVTNGPLIRPSVEGELPGHTFKADAGQPLELLVALTLSTRDKIRYLEIIKNGRIEQEVNLDSFKELGGKLPPVKFTESGWFLVRAVADNPQTYRFASTGPYYVEVGYQPRISRKSVQFFLDWTNKRADEITAATKADDAPATQSAWRYAEQAKAFWQALLAKANAE
jgi:hypothetical protein